MTARSWQIGLTAVALAVGFVLAVQVRTERSIETSLQVTSGRLGEVAYRYQQAEQRQADLRERLAELRQGIADEEQRAAAGREATAALAADLSRMRTLAGLSAVHGPGVLVTISDSTRALRPGEDPNLVLIHYSDVYAVVAALFAGGAEAVAVNGERVVGTTGISCVGTTILCNARRLAPPYRIEAIGDPHALRTVVTARGGILDELRAFDFPVTVAVESDVRLSAYAGTFVHRFATPVDTGR
ncbi:MAG TPA: DUF881 domain-containing protein [bacterium]|nr:DUF881 domain-containing protein [bacterium]